MTVPVATPALTSPYVRVLLSKVDATLAKSGLIRSPVLFSAAAQPKSCVDNHYCIMLQSRNANTFREGWEETMRLEHTLTVSVIKVIKPMGQFESLLAATDIEGRLIAAMMVRRNLPDVVVHYVATRRVLTPSREHMVLDIDFSMTGDFQWAVAP